MSKEWIIAKYGDRGPSMYSTWQGMKRRCYNPKDQDYHSYGGRGIVVCEEWKRNFERFRDDMGDNAPGLSLDRIQVNGNYEKSNCRWVTRHVQSRNTRRNVNVDIGGVKMTLKDACTQLNLSRWQMGRLMLRYGFSFVEILFIRNQAKIKNIDFYHVLYTLHHQGILISSKRVPTLRGKCFEKKTNTHHKII